MGVDALAAREGPEVHAGAEGAARAGQDRDDEFVVLLEVVDCGGECLCGRFVDRVAGVWPVDRDDEDSAVVLSDDFVAHTWPIAFVSRARGLGRQGRTPTQS